MRRSNADSRPLASMDDGTIGLIFAGETNVQNRDDPASAFANVREVFADADLRFCHLEGPLCEPSQDPLRPDIPHKLNWRHSHPQMVRALVGVGIDAVSCASNVTFPASAALRSAEVLREASIPFAGIGLNRQAAHAPAIVEKAGVRIGLLSYTSVFWPHGHAAGENTPGTAVLRARTAFEPGPRALEMPGAAPRVVTWVDQEEIEGLQADVRALAERVDIVLVSCHWGVSSSPEPADYQRQLGRAAIKAGAHAVLGHHPHVIQPVEFHRGRPIFYSVGNFIFDWPKMRNRHQDGMLLRFDIADRDIKRIRLVPVRRDADNQVSVLDPSHGEGARIVERIKELSSGAILLSLAGPDVELSDPAAETALRSVGARKVSSGGGN